MSKFTIRTSIVVAGLAALVPVIGLTGAAPATADAGIRVVVLPAIQYDPNNPEPPLLAGQYASVMATGCVAHKTVTVGATLNGSTLKVGPYNPAGGWGQDLNGHDAYTTNTGKLTAAGTLRVTVTCTSASTGKTATVITTSPVRGTTAPLPNTGV